MSNLLVGDPSIFAIESFIAQPFERLSQRALGYFLVHVGGQVYGVHSPEATLLACSLDAVRRRLDQRGTHSLSIGVEESAEYLAYAVQTALYRDVPPEKQFWGMSAEKLSDELAIHEIILAPDGDAAFDDGGHVLQFDQGEQVRLVAFKNSSNLEMSVNSIADVKMSAENFYLVLDSWQHQFETAWLAALRRQA